MLVSAFKTQKSLGVLLVVYILIGVIGSSNIALRLMFIIHYREPMIIRMDAIETRYYFFISSETWGL